MPAAPHYDLPAWAIAQVPIEPRDQARLLVDHGPHHPPEHRRVADLGELVGPGDVVVVNESKVIPARLNFTKASGGAVEVLLLEPEAEDHEAWTALVRPSRKVAAGTRLVAGPDLVVEVGERLAGDASRRHVRLHVSEGDIESALARHGQVPLPPYIHSPLADPERYQTVYAASPGSVAAPTAGLHLTRQVLDRCVLAGAELATVDLAVGLDTFKPVTAERIEDHVVHSEPYRVPPATMEVCRRAKRVVAVGTTTVRALETAAATGELEGRTRLLIHGDYRWQMVDALLTNFHLPGSTLLLLVESFMGPRWRSLYATALSSDYRFLSFGDAMFIPEGPGRR